MAATKHTGDWSLTEQVWEAAAGGHQTERVSGLLEHWEGHAAWEGSSTVSLTGHRVPTEPGAAGRCFWKGHGQQTEWGDVPPHVGSNTHNPPRTRKEQKDDGRVTSSLFICSFSLQSQSKSPVSPEGTTNFPPTALRFSGIRGSALNSGRFSFRGQ